MSKQNNKTEFFSLREAADEMRLTRQAVYVAIKQKRLKAEKIKGKWYSTKQDLDNYRLNKYNRDLRKYEGENIFSFEKGLYSVKQISMIFHYELGRSYPRNKIYYMLKIGKLMGYRKGAAWVIEKESAVKLLEWELSVNKKQMEFFQ